MVLMSEPRHIVDRIPDRADRCPLGEGKRRRRAVHANEAASVAGHVVEVASVAVVKPVFEAEPASVPGHKPPPVEEAAVERMRL